MRSPIQVKQEQKTEMQSPVQVKQEQKTDSNIDFTEEKPITKSDSIKSKGKITGSENQSINTADNIFTDSENAARKMGNKPQNPTIKTEEEVAEKNCDGPSDNQLSQNNELAVSNNADNIKQSPKKDKKQKKKSQERFNDSLNDRNLELVGSPSMAACDTNEEPHKKKHKKKKVVNDNKVSAENNVEENILPSVCNLEVTNFKLADEVMTVKGEGVDDTPEVRSEANTAKNEEQQKKKHKKRKMDKRGAGNENVLLSDNNLEGNLRSPICNPDATTNVELVTEVMTDSRVSLSKGADNTFAIRSEVNTVEVEESLKKKRRKRKMDKRRAENENELASENNLEENLHPSNCNLNATSSVALVTEVMTDSGVSSSKGADDTSEIRSETNIAENEEPSKKKRKKSKMDKKRAMNENKLSSENNSEGNLYASVCNLNATTNLELAPEVMTVSGIRLSSVDDAPDISLEANTVENEEPSKKKHKKRKMDKKGAGNENVLLSDNNLEGNLHPQICNPNATTNVELVTEVMTDSRVSLSKGVDNTFDIRSEVNTVEVEESSKKKRRKRKIDKRRAENKNELVSESNLEGNLHPSNCNPNATSSVALVTEVMTDSGVSSSKGVDDTSEIRSEANIAENEELSKKKRKKSKMDKKRAMNENELLSENNSEGNLHPSICISNATTTEVMTDTVVHLSKSVGGAPEIRSKAITVKNEEPQKEKRKKRKKDKNRVANKSELSNENDSGGNIHPSDCHPNVTTNLELATDAMTVGENVLSNFVDDTSEIRSEANTVKNEDLQKKKRKKKKMDKMRVANVNELLSKNNSKGNLSICNPNATNNLGLAAQTMTSDGISSSKAVDDASEIRSESNTVNGETPKKKKKSKRMIMVSGNGILNNSLKENFPPLMEGCVSNASVNCELADKSSDEASQLVNQQLSANETSSKGAHNSNEINLVSNTLKSGSPHRKKEHKKKGHKQMMIDDQDVKNKGIEVKNIEISQDNRLLPTFKNEIHTPRRFGRRKLLVLDLNGLLCEVIRGYPKTKKPYKRVNRSAVFKRPFCDDFLKFCCENFDIGVWSSRKMENVHGVVNVIMNDFRDDILFCWSASECTYTPHKTLEDYRKPLVLKKLQKLWNKEAGNLPWELGDYSSSNTLLIDDSPYKAICNPPYTGVFPYPYDFNDENDNALGPGGDLRVFLEGLALAEDVESYVREHPFGKPAITSANPSWSFYERIINCYK